MTLSGANEDTGSRRSHPFIVIEGIDGVGKTTVARMLSIRLQAHYYRTPPAVLERFAQTAPAGDTLLLRSYADSAAFSNTQSRFLFYLFAVSCASSEIDLLLASAPVICDRFLASTLAYHWALDPHLRDASLDWLSLIEPDFQFLLTIDEETRRTRLEHRHSQLTDSELEAHFDVLAQAQRNFETLGLTLVEVGPHTPEETVERIIALIVAGDRYRLG